MDPALTAGASPPPAAAARAERRIPHSLTALGEREAAAAAEAVRSGWVKGGPRMAALEDEVSAATGAAGGVACTSGTQALHLALRAAGLGPGDQVALPSYVCRQVLDAVCLAGAEPLVCDSSPLHFGVELDDLARRRTGATRAVVQVHQLGVRAPVDHPALDGLLLVDDLCQRPPHAAFAPVAPSPAVARVISFEATKPVTCGEGGLLLSDDPALLARARSLRDAPYDWKAAAAPAPLTDIQAAVARVQWGRYPEFLRERRALADRYAARLGSGRAVGPWGFRAHPAMGAADTLPVRWVGECADADGLIAAALRAQVEIKRPVKPQALHQLLGLPDGDFPGAARLMRTLVSLPLYPGLGHAAQDRVVAAVLGEGPHAG
jgi:dTDP-4-amino-4,6-dideoxygalactose transaminase